MKNNVKFRLNPYDSGAKYVSVTGILLALAVVFTSLESMFSAFLPAGVRIGLANIVVMAAIIAINVPTAFLITVLKSVFVLLTRGITAGFMSLSGGVLAFAVTALMFRFTNSSYVLMSVLSSVAHIIGQLLLTTVMLQSAYAFYYAPVLLITSIIAGVCTGLVLNVVLEHTSLLKPKHKTNHKE